MNPVKFPGPIKSSSQSIERIECENRWYALVFEFLKSIETTQPENFQDVSLDSLFENTYSYLNQILCFHNGAFYRTEEQEDAFALEYWQPVSREPLFRRQIAPYSRVKSLIGAESRTAPMSTPMKRPNLH